VFPRYVPVQSFSALRTRCIFSHRLVPVVCFPALGMGRKVLLYVATGSCVPAFAVAITLVFALKGSGEEKGRGWGLRKTHGFEAVMV